MPAAPQAGGYKVFGDAHFLGHNVVVRSPAPSVGSVQLTRPTGRIASLIEFANEVAPTLCRPREELVAHGGVLALASTVRFELLLAVNFDAFLAEHTALAASGAS